jgi:hypothetical protein
LQLLLFVVTVAALIAVIPLIVWAGTSSWRHAMHALRSYLRIAAWAIVAVGGLALAVSFAEVTNLLP